MTFFFNNLPQVYKDKIEFYFATNLTTQLSKIGVILNIISWVGSKGSWGRFFRLDHYRYILYYTYIYTQCRRAATTCADVCNWRYHIFERSRTKKVDSRWSRARTDNVRPKWVVEFRESIYNNIIGVTVGRFRRERLPVIFVFFFF